MQFHLPVIHSPHFLTADSLPSRSQPNWLPLGEVVPDHPVQKSCPSHHPFLMLYTVLVTPDSFLLYLSMCTLCLSPNWEPRQVGTSPVMLSALPPASSTAPGSAPVPGHQDMNDCVLPALQSSSHHPPNLPQTLALPGLDVVWERLEGVGKARGVIGVHAQPFPSFSPRSTEDTLEGAVIWDSGCRALERRGF